MDCDYEIKKNKIITTTEFDLKNIIDFCKSATKITITEDEAIDALKKMPSDIIYGIIQWSETDTVIRDDIFLWFKKNISK